MPITEFQATPYFKAVCDDCGSQHPERALNRDAARRLAQGDRWKIEGDRCQCVKCQKLAEVKREDKQA